VVDADDTARTGLPPLIRRIPVQIPALLLLVVCGCSFVAIYLDVPPTARGILGAVALGLFALVVACLRMGLEADESGVAVRRLLKWRWIGWSRIERVEIAQGIRGSESIRVVARDGELLDVPPTLLQPTLPTTRPRAQAQLRGVLAEIQARHPDSFRH